MKPTTWLRILIGLALAILVAVPIIRACAPEGPALAFTWSTHPDLPLNAFAKGELGILQPTYARSYLVVAYRFFNGRPLTPREQRGALELWESRLQGGVRLPAGLPDAGPRSEAMEVDEPDAPDWAKVRARHTQKVAPESISWRWDENFYRPEISDSAYETAARTLEDRSKRWKPARVAQWIEAQDQVFATNGQHKLIPEVAPPWEEFLFQKDRAYQIACAQLYSGEFETARASFAAISADVRSPWCRVAAYLVGRSWYQEGQLRQTKDPEIARRCFREAHMVFKRLKEGGLPRVEAAYAPESLPARRLELGVDRGEQQALALIDPGAVGTALVQRLLKPGPEDDFGVLLHSYTNLLDANLTGEREFEDDPAKMRGVPEGFLRDYLTEWVLRFQEMGPRSFVLAQRKWKTSGTFPWLLLALASARPGDNGVEGLLEAAEKVPVSHPGYESLSFHRARYLIAAGRKEESKQLIGLFLDGTRAAQFASAPNLWRAIRMPLADTPEAFLADALRTPVGIYDFPPEGRDSENAYSTWSMGIQGPHKSVRKLLHQVPSPKQFLQGDGAQIINLQVPTEVLLQLARRGETPPHLRKEWIRAAWVRAVILDRWDLAKEATPDLLQVEPDLKASLDGFLGANPHDQSQIALLTLLRHPGLRWMVFQGINRRNYTEAGDRPIPLRHRDTYLAASWWGNSERRRDSESINVQDWSSWRSEYFYPTAHAVERPLFNLVGRRAQRTAFLSGDQAERGAREGRTLMALEDAPDWLARRALTWAQESPEDHRIPEVLHHAVRAGKLGGVKKLDRACFRLLHGRYKASQWAVKTPFHY